MSIRPYQKRSAHGAGGLGTGDVWNGFLTSIFGEDSDVTIWGRQPSILSELGRSLGSSFLRLDTTETDDAYVVSADLPGVAKENIKASLDNDGLLSLEATRDSRDERNESPQVGRTVHIRERSFGQVKRSLQLPKDANVQSANCTFDNGVLTITVKKSPTDAQRKTLLTIH